MRYCIGFGLLLLCAVVGVSANGTKGFKCYPFSFKFDVSHVDTEAIGKVLPQITMQPKPVYEGSEGILGKLPRVDNGKVINGGIPQLANLTLHVEYVTKYLEQAIPDVNTVSQIDIDYEAWNLIWEENSATEQPYVNMSLDLARKQNPGMNSTQIEQEAKKAFTSAARQVFSLTIETIHKLRPHLKVCCYGYPIREYWNGYNTSNGEYLREKNDELTWLWNLEDVICPSVYQFYPSTTKAIEARNREYIYSTVKEAVRCSNLASVKKPVFPYTWHRYHDGVNFVMDVDMSMYWEESQRAGADGVVMWGDEKATPAKGTTYFETKVPALMNAFCPKDE